MNEQENFLTVNQKSLLDIAIWTKYLAWIALAFNIIIAIFVIIKYPIEAQRWQAISSSYPVNASFKDLFMSAPVYYFVDIVSSVASPIVSGAIFYVVLKGISLGLNMIVETNINVMDIDRQGGKNEF